MFLLIIAVLCVLAVILPALFHYIGNGDSRKDIREAKAEALSAKQREKIATKALRAILNGAGNPVYEAQIALDEIDETYTKELN